MCHKLGAARKVHYQSYLVKYLVGHYSLHAVTFPGSSHTSDTVGFHKKLEIPYDQCSEPCYKS